MLGLKLIQVCQRGQRCPKYFKINVLVKTSFRSNTWFQTTWFKISVYHRVTPCSDRVIVQNRWDNGLVSEGTKPLSHPFEPILTGDCWYPSQSNFTEMCKLCKKWFQLIFYIFSASARGQWVHANNIVSKWDDRKTTWRWQQLVWTFLQIAIKILFSINTHTTRSTWVQGKNV